MPIDPLGMYRLQAFRQNVNQGVNALLGNEALQRKKDELEARRIQIMRAFRGSELTPTTTGDEAYNRTTGAMRNLIGVGTPEAFKAADLVSRNAGLWQKTHPQPKAQSKRPGIWTDVSTSPGQEWPLTKQFGNETRRLQRYVYTDTNEPTDWHQYAGGGSTRATSNTAETRRQIDLQKQKDSYNQADASIRTYEKRYGKATLDEWKGLLDKDHPNLLAISSDPNLSIAEKSQQMMAALGEVADPTLRSKLQIAAYYAMSLAKRDAYKTNISDRGYDVDETGSVVAKRKKSAPGRFEILDVVK